MDAPRAFFNAILWFIGRHGQAFHLVDPAAVGVVSVLLLGLGMQAISRGPTRERSLEGCPDRVCPGHYGSNAMRVPAKRRAVLDRTHGVDSGLFRP